MGSMTNLVKQLIFIFPTTAESVLELYLREGIAHFMQDTELFTARTQIVGQRGIRDYYLAPPDCKHPISVKQVVPLETGAFFSDDFTYSPHGRVLTFSRDIVDKMRYAVDFSYFISGTECEIPDELTVTHASAIIAYAKAMLHLIKDGGNYSPVLADRATAQYALGVNRAVSIFYKDTGGSITIDKPWRI